MYDRLDAWVESVPLFPGSRRDAAGAPALGPTEDLLDRVTSMREETFDLLGEAGSSFLSPGGELEAEVVTELQTLANSLGKVEAVLARMLAEAQDPHRIFTSHDPIEREPHPSPFVLTTREYSTSR
jgi:hypothetical protein